MAAHHPSPLGRRAMLGAAVAGAGAAALLGTATPAAATGRAAGRAATDDLRTPTVVAHRGASGYRPEHTMGSYQLGLDLGADIIEQDLVPTKDGHLVCRHENDITGTTDVADHAEFADRRATKTVDGVELNGWFTEDFTLEELRTLRATERIPEQRPNNTLYDGRWRIPTFDEVLRWAADEGRRRGRPVWLYTETKHPTYFRSIGLGLERPLADLLRRHRLHRAGAPVILQSFEPTSMERLAELVETPRVVLFSSAGSRPWDLQEAGDPRTVADLITRSGLREISEYAQGIGPTLDLVIPKKSDGSLDTPTRLVRDAHDADLLVHPYTVRNENRYLPAEFRRGDDPHAYGDVFGALNAYFGTGIDGVFADHPDTALLAAADFRR
ncbi:glycerophosphodiester phosphodiesterase [Streptomyces radicis]|uniref:glycerophosphodiester phosphodiesterase n=1 Tax=Streptomyces radicis TaxID=1750517 RepID=A0A3A9WK86_9ACTN|nr:glycerophosphodiester phosphodiesterase [Streptomyces radicis]RKN12703.1 glycerophosphodiester phosphodiesterase [Streptomyces radicis]RKN27534.1 glycerophosphodiester phosphodiesterase [Streptomyces radicis]